MAEDGTDNADTSKWEQYLQGSKGNLNRGPSSPDCSAPNNRSLSCHLSQGAMPQLPLPLQEHPRLCCSNTLEYRSPTLPPAAPRLWEPHQDFSPLPLLPAPRSPLTPQQRSRLRKKPEHIEGSRSRQATVPRRCVGWGWMAQWGHPEPEARHRKAGGRIPGAGRR